VWRAADEVLGREVAVKVLSPQFAADAGFVARFEREARHAARLSHPRLVTVFDCGIDNGTAFIVMELVAGRTLRQVLDDARVVPPGEAAGIAVAVCEALEVAHAARLVHRDIKPANIVVSGGEVKVLDFGIARADGSAGGTRTVGVLGTAAYLSPEQASGRPAGPQSDLYSLGCVLFEMLTGSPPFTADSAVGLAYRHVHDDPGPPSARRPGVPAPLDRITAQLLAKDPAARPAGAAAARAGLLAALNPDATAVLPVPGTDGVPPGPGGRGRRRPARAEILLAAALAATVAALAAVLLTGAPGHPAPRAAPRVTPSAASHSSAAQPAPHKTHKPPRKRPAAGHASALPPVAAAAAAVVGDLEAGVADGQVAPKAGQDLYNHLQQLLFGPPGQDPQQIQKQYAQLLQSYDQHQSQGQITGRAAITVRHALHALGAAVGAG
jgi:eukaryotic-like serine/threonine-protein kinase